MGYGPRPRIKLSPCPGSTFEDNRGEKSHLPWLSVRWATVFVQGVAAHGAKRPSLQPDSLGRQAAVRGGDHAAAQEPAAVAAPAHCYLCREAIVLAAVRALLSANLGTAYVDGRVHLPL